jgi:hypothetical protein
MQQYGNTIQDWELICLIIPISIPSDINKDKKEAGKILKYKYLLTEI